MKKILLLLICACPMWAAYSLPPGSKCLSDLGSGLVGSINCTLNSTTNDLIAISFTITEAAPGTVTVSDTCVSTWNAVDSIVGLGGFNASIYSYYAISACTNASNVVTVSWTGGTAAFNFLAATEYSGNATSMVLDTHQVAQSAGGSTSCATSNLVTSNSGDLLTVLCVANGVFPSAGSGYTMEELGTNNAAGYEDQVAGAAGSYAANETLSSSVSWGAVSMAFAPSSNLNGSTLFGSQMQFGPSKVF